MVIAIRPCLRIWLRLSITLATVGSFWVLVPVGLSVIIKSMGMSLVLLAAAWTHWRRDWKVSNTTGSCVLPNRFAIPSRFCWAVEVRRQHYASSHETRL